MLAEWSLPPWSPSLEIDLAEKRGEWHNLNLDRDAEQTETLDLGNADDWTRPAQRIHGVVGKTE